MPRQNISKLGDAPKGYRPHKRGYRIPGKHVFETLQAARNEDSFRERALRKAAGRNDLSEKERSAALLLAKRLERSLARGKIPATLASSRYVRQRRKRAIGWLSCLTALETPKQVGQWINPAFFTVYHPDWIKPCGKLDDFDPTKLLSSFRSDLNRLGARPQDGWLYVWLHGECDADNKRFHLHLHGMAAGGFIPRIAALQRRKKYRVANASLRLSKASSKNLARRISYVLQAWWPWRQRTHPVTGERFDQPQRRRIPEPHHARYLLWLDKWQLADTILIMGLKTEHGCLVPTGTAYMNKKLKRVQQSV